MTEIPWINLNGYCDGPHPEKLNGTWRYPLGRTAIRKFIKSNGVTTYELVCTTNGCRFKTSAIPSAGAQRLIGKLPMVDARHTSASTHTCGYLGCDSTEIEWHHYAPRNTFGYEADSYPCLPLCRAHHRHWHQMMDGYRCHARGFLRDPEEIALELLEQERELSRRERRDQIDRQIGRHHQRPT